MEIVPLVMYGIFGFFVYLLFVYFEGKKCHSIDNDDLFCYLFLSITLWPLFVAALFIKFIVLKLMKVGEYSHNLGSSRYRKKF